MMSVRMSSTPAWRLDSRRAQPDPAPHRITKTSATMTRRLRHRRFSARTRQKQRDRIVRQSHSRRPNPSRTGLAKRTFELSHRCG